LPSQDIDDVSEGK